MQVIKALRKLFNNAVFGKMLQDARAFKNLQFFFANEWPRAVKIASHPWVESWRTIVPDKMFMMSKKRAAITLSNPILVGQAILDLSKVIMYRLHYEKIRPQFMLPDGTCRIKLCYTDTDSLVYVAYGLKESTVWSDFRFINDRHDIFDLSEIKNPESHPLTVGLTKEQRDRNKKKLGTIKDEMGGITIKRVICLQSKTYSVVLEEPLEVEHHNRKKVGVVNHSCMPALE